MKTNDSVWLTVLFLMVTPFLSLSQDMIYLHSGEKIESVVTEISDTDIKYKAYNFQDGPTRVVKPAQVYMIRYEKGNEEFFQKDPDLPSEKKLTPKNNFYKNGCDQYYASFALGHGPSYGWIGIRYQGRIGKEQGFGWHAGGGVFPAILDIDHTYFLYGGGFKFYYFRGLYIDLQYGRFMVARDDIYYEYLYPYTNYYEPREVVLHGPSFTAGGDWFFNKYIGINAAFGISYDVQQVRSGPPVYPALEWGVICKW